MPIVAFSCTPRLHKVYTKAEVVHLTPGLLGFIGNVLQNILLTLEYLQIGVRTSRL